MLRQHLIGLLLKEYFGFSMAPTHMASHSIQLHCLPFTSIVMLTGHDQLMTGAQPLVFAFFLAPI
jgi:hypothetical protein